jgi:hypothetical protein
VLECGFWLFFLFFRHSVLCITKGPAWSAIPIRNIRDWFFVNKKYCTKGPAWSAIPIRNTKRLNFCEENLQETDQFKTFWGSRNFSGGCCLAESRYQTSLNILHISSWRYGLIVTLFWCINDDWNMCVWFCISRNMLLWLSLCSTIFCMIYLLTCKACDYLNSLANQLVSLRIPDVS